jgi:hypothetical protein
VSRFEDRALAITGTQPYAASLFDTQESVLNAGVLFSIPALIAQGLNHFFKILNPLPSGFYGLHHIILTLCFMTLCRIKNPEQLKKNSPGEFGKLLGLDRIPEVKHFRTKLRQITDQSKMDEVYTELFQDWVEDLPELFFYVDGHVTVYHGEEANLPKRFVSRQKLCLPGSAEFWVNDEKGLPLMVIHGEITDKIKNAIEKIIPKILKDTGLKIELDSQDPTFTIVMDREAYEPLWFKFLWETYRVAIITYRKNVKDNWDESLFDNIDIHTVNGDVTMRLCELGTLLNGVWFREVRKLSTQEHQTAIITTHPTLPMDQIAVKMFSRWTQENFFKYVIENFDFDRMIEYGTETVDLTQTIPNPEHKKITYQIKKGKQNIARLKALLVKDFDHANESIIDKMPKIITKYNHLIEQIDALKNEIEKLKLLQHTIPKKITIEQMSNENRYNRLKQESKKLKNAVIMLSYRAETALYNLMSDFYVDIYKEGRMILKEIFTTDADLIPDYINNKLTVRLHTLSTPRANNAAKELCDRLNQTQTNYPFTKLMLNYETAAFQVTKVVEV